MSKVPILLGACVLFFVLGNANAFAFQVDFSVDEIRERADTIAIGTITNTWFDFRPFNDPKVVDTATLHVEKWIKHKQSSDTIEVRSYGKWAKFFDSLFGVTRFDTGGNEFEVNQRVLVFLSWEDPTMYMGEGYYPFWKGKYILKDGIAENVDSERTTTEEELVSWVECCWELGQKENEN